MANSTQQKQNEKDRITNSVCAEKRNGYWVKRLERFLTIAIQAEADHDYLRAGRAFVLALFCEGRLHNDVANPWTYIFQAMPVY
jgi:hypothetical protein